MSEEPTNNEPTNNENTPANPQSGEKTFTQEELNSYVAKERRQTEQRLNKQIEEMQSTIEELKVSDEDRNSLKEQLNALKSEKKSTEVQLQDDLKKANKEIEKLTKKLDSEVNTWKGRYESSQIEAAVTKAAEKHLAFDSEQILGLLSHSTVLRETLDDDGKGTGKFEAYVLKFKDQDSKGEAVELDLKVDDAVKRMREQPKYGNLFRSNAKDGTSLSQSPAGPTGDQQEKVLGMGAGQDRSNAYRKMREQAKA